MTTTTASGEAAIAMHKPMKPRSSELHGVIRVIAGIIHWWSKKDTWAPDPMEARQWQDRESAYACAQSMRGLLVVGCGLQDLETSPTEMRGARQEAVSAVVLANRPNRS